jgi:hypothetical protein
MEKGKTTTGFEFTINPDVFDDWEMLEKLNAIDKGDTNLVVDVAREVLGIEQLDALKAHIKADKGKVSITDMMAALEEIFEACSAKN